MTILLGGYHLAVLCIGKHHDLETLHQSTYWCLLDHCSMYQRSCMYLEADECVPSGYVLFIDEHYVLKTIYRFFLRYTLGC